LVKDRLKSPKIRPLLAPVLDVLEHVQLDLEVVLRDGGVNAVIPGYLHRHL
jgi:hypothetical protein